MATLYDDYALWLAHRDRAHRAREQEWAQRLVARRAHDDDELEDLLAMIDTTEVNDHD